MSSSLNVDLVTTKFRLQQSKYNMFFKLLIQSELQSELRSCVWESRWTSWAPVPNKPTVSVDVKQHFNQLQMPIQLILQTVTTVNKMHHSMSFQEL